MTNAASVTAPEYDMVELRGGRLYKIRRCEARVVGEDRMAPVVKCYCRSNDVVTVAEAEAQRRPTLVFPMEHFLSIEGLIGKDLEGRIFTDTHGRRVKFHLDLSEHAGFNVEDNGRSLESPWYDDSVLKD
jgi:hypothetical protein